MSKPVYGIAWSASNPSIQYCDDWCTEEYKKIFAIPGRGDLQRLKSLGFNLVRTYYWDPARSHDSFLREADRVQIGVEVPIHNGLVHNRDIRGITKLVNEAKNYKCVKLYTVGNEMPPEDADNIAWALGQVTRIDPSRPVMHSTIFDENFKSAKNILRRVDSLTFNKYIAGINMYFYSNPPKSWGDCLQASIRDYFNDSMLRDTPLIISEIGYGGMKEDLAFDAILNTLYGGFCALGNFPKFLGFELFSFQNESWKGAQNNESSYGLVKEDATGTPRRQYYAVENFGKTGFFRSIMNKFR
jgi:hypothetical protein